MSDAIEARQVTVLMLQAGRYHMHGVRCYYYAFPLLFWLFGPLFFVGGSIALVALMLKLHRTHPDARGGGAAELGV